MEFAVFSQKLEIDVDFATQSIQGRTVLTIEPKSADLKSIRLNSRQCRIKRATAENKAAVFNYRDPYGALELFPGTTVNQYHILQSRIEESLEFTYNQPEEALEILIPESVKIKEQKVASTAAVVKPGNGVEDGDEEMPDAPAPQSALQAQQAQVTYGTIEIAIDFEVKHFRDGLHFVGVEPGDERYPHAYTRNSDFPGSASCIFPCVDNATSRHEWDVSIRYPRTLADALRKAVAPKTNTDSSLTNGHTEYAVTTNGTDHDRHEDYITPLNQEDKALEMRAICSGNLTDDVVDEKDHTRKIASFRIDEAVAARHLGIAVGPFEHIDLSEFRESDQDERLGTHAVRVHGFCLPGRGAEVRNTCMPLAAAIDYFSTSYTAYPGKNHKVVFVDDLWPEVADSATLSICSTRLLIPEDILDPLFAATRELLRGLAAQWLGILVFPRDLEDFWITVGGAYFMADQFGAQLWGKNELKHRLKLASNQIVDQDIRRPSLYDLGRHIADIPGWLDFMELKAPVVLQILHHRMVKLSGRNGVNRVFWRLLSNTVGGNEGAVSTSSFIRATEKVGHVKFDDFFNQWIYGSGYPVFLINQKFNKKKLCVEMVFKQTQSELWTAESGVPMAAQHMKVHIDSQNIRRLAKEDSSAIEAPETQRVFSGPMTIRIHEADGTPYEHIVTIKEPSQRLEIPYNTKYKRLKRSKRQKERQQANAAANPGADGQEDALLYCLGDVLQTEAEFTDWRLQDWPPEEEDRMGQESYEWIRVDKDFEWISKTYFVQPGYMYVSQLQQDNDVVAQIEALEWMRTQRGTPLMATFLIRTLMDSRYFYGVRTMAADLLSSCGDIGFFHLEKAFQTFYCLPDSPMTRSNDFSNRAEYFLQCAIPQAMAKIRAPDGKVPFEIRQFFIDKLKFNDNSNNEYSDCHYVATLMSCLATSLASPNAQQTIDEFTLGDADDEELLYRDRDFQEKAIHEIQRYRRIDEWIPSFQNAFSVTSLDCIAGLMLAKAIPIKGAEFLQYTQPGNSDEVRLKAFEIVAKLGILASQSVLAYCLLSLATDPSPYFRRQLWDHIWSGLGMLLTIMPSREAVSSAAQTDGLVLEQATTDNNRQELAKRTESIEGALDALMDWLLTYKTLPAALVDTLASDTISATDFVELLDLCEIVYEPKDSLILPLKLPRFWKCRSLGNGKLAFYRGERVRTKAYDIKMSPFAEVMEKGRKVKAETSAAPDQGPKPTMLRLKTNQGLQASEPSRSQRSASPGDKRKHESSVEEAASQPLPKIRLMNKGRQQSQSQSQSQASPPPPPVQQPQHSAMQAPAPPAPSSAQASRRSSLIINGTTSATVSPTARSPAPPMRSPAVKAASPMPPPRAASTASPAPRASPVVPAPTTTPRAKKSLLVRLKIPSHRLVKAEAEETSTQVSLNHVPSPAPSSVSSAGSSVDVPLMKQSTAPTPAPLVEGKPVTNDVEQAAQSVDAGEAAPPPLQKAPTLKLKFGFGKKT